MPWNQHSDSRYEATRGDVLAAVGPVLPNPLSGPDNPDPFGHDERPLTEFLIACEITKINRIPWPNGQVGRAIRRDKLRELLTEMVADGTIIGRPRKEWAAMGRESPSRASDILYAHPALAHRWEQERSVPRETKEDHDLPRPCP
jgi:hypothetical protein